MTHISYSCPHSCVSDMTNSINNVHINNPRISVKFPRNTVMKRHFITQVEYDEFLKFFTEKKIPERHNLNKGTRQAFKRRLENYFMDEDLNLCLNEDNLKKIVVCNDDEEKISEIIKKNHEDSGHRGRNETFERISKKYTGITRDMVLSEIQKCPGCMSFTPLHSNPGVIPIRTFCCWERIQMDIVDLSEYQELNDGYRYLLNILDCFSKFLYSFPLKNKTAEAVFDVLSELFLIEGPPYILHSDNGKEFKNVKIQTLCHNLNIKIIHGRARHPQSQGQIERANQTISRMIQRSFYKARVWYKDLKKVVIAYNTSRHRATKMIPFQVFRGRNYQNNDLRIINRVNARITIFSDANTSGSEVESEENLLEINTNNLSVLLNSENLVLSETANESVMSENPIVTELWSHLTQDDIDDLIEEAMLYQEGYQKDFIEIQTERENIQQNIIANGNEYSNNMIKSTSVHSRKCHLKKGDEVLVASDYDNNRSTRPRLFIENFRTEATVKGITRNGMVKVVIKGTRESRCFKPNMLKLNVKE